jgi:hypothetical protein
VTGFATPVAGVSHILSEIPTESAAARLGHAFGDRLARAGFFAARMPYGFPVAPTGFRVSGVGAARSLP